MFTNWHLNIQGKIASTVLNKRGETKVAKAGYAISTLHLPLKNKDWIIRGHKRKPNQTKRRERLLVFIHEL